MPKVDSPSRNGVERAQLSDEEKRKLNLAVSRGFEDTRSLDTQVIVQKLMDYKEELREAAEIAKAQFDQTFDGQAPTSGNFGVDQIHAGYFGYDSWDNVPDVTAGNTQTWLDNSVPDNLGGSGGVDSPLTIGDPAVHIICGIGTYAQSPKVTRLRWRLNDQPRPSISTEQNFRNTDLRIKWLDTPIVIKSDDDVYAELYADQDGSEAPYLVGFSFVRSKDMRELDPANMAGTDPSNIVRE